MRQSKTRSLVIGIAAILSVATAAQAATITNSAGIPNAQTVIDFENTTFNSGDSITNQFSADGVIFSSGLVFTPQSGTFPGVTANNIGNFNGGSGNQFSLIFTVDQTAAAFGFASNPQNSIFSAFLDGVLVETFTTPTTFDNTNTAFLGFTGITFDELTINSPSFFLIDNIQLGTAISAVPLPAGFLLMGTALAGFGVMLRRKKT